MIKQILYKLFNIEERCPTCEVLKEQLAIEQQFNRVLMQKLIHPEEEAKPEPEPMQEMKPLKTGTRFIPHAVRQQMMEAEDLKTLEIMKKKHKELTELEEEVLGNENGKENDNASQIREAI